MKPFRYLFLPLLFYMTPPSRNTSYSLVTGSASLPSPTNPTIEHRQRRRQPATPAKPTTKKTKSTKKTKTTTKAKPTQTIPYHVVIFPNQTRPSHLRPKPHLIHRKTLPHIFVYKGKKMPLKSDLFTTKNLFANDNIYKQKLADMFRRTQSYDDESTRSTHIDFIKSHTGFPGDWIARSQKRNNISRVWHKLSSDDNLHDATLYGHYVHGTYNWTVNTLNVSGIICGEIPSLICLRAMIADALMEQNKTIAHSTDCKKTFSVPILYNLPRWDICVRILPQAFSSPKSFDPNTHRLLIANTFVLTSLAISNLLLEDAAVDDVCRSVMNPFRAIQRNLFYIDRPGNVSAALSLLLSDLENTTHPTTHRKLNTSTFYDATMLLSTALYSGKDAELRRLHASSIAVSNGNVLIDVGELHVPRLLLQNNAGPRRHSLASPPRNLSQLVHLDPIVLDYLDTFALGFLHRQITRGGRNGSTHVPIGPHRRRTGLIPLYGV